VLPARTSRFCGPPGWRECPERVAVPAHGERCRPARDRGPRGGDGPRQRARPGTRGRALGRGLPEMRALIAATQRLRRYEPHRSRWLRSSRSRYTAERGLRMFLNTRPWLTPPARRPEPGRTKRSPTGDHESGEPRGPPPPNPASVHHPLQEGRDVQAQHDTILSIILCIILGGYGRAAARSCPGVGRIGLYAIRAENLQPGARPAACRLPDGTRVPDAATRPVAAPEPAVVSPLAFIACEVSGLPVGGSYGLVLIGSGGRGTGRGTGVSWNSSVSRVWPRSLVMSAGCR
jgi:hypothetical protein